MCGILGIFGSGLNDRDMRKKMIECSMRLRHRGPDWSGYVVDRNNGIAHERLAIIDPESGAQPLKSPDGNIIVAANGEIYNYKELYAGLTTPYTPLTGSDCEVVIPLYEQVWCNNDDMAKHIFIFLAHTYASKLEHELHADFSLLSLSFLRHHHIYQKPKNL